MRNATVTAKGNNPVTPAAFNLDHALKALERHFIESALCFTRGNVSQAAKLLGIKRPTLYDRLGKKGLSKEPQAS